MITAYVLAFGSLLPLGGRLGDAFGRKAMFIVGLLGFAIASAAGGAAPNNIVLAVVGITDGLTLLHNSAESDKPRLSVPSTIVGSAAIFGLVFGSAKAQTDGWGSAVTLTPLITGGVLLAGFVVLQKVVRHPLIPLRVVADRNRGAAYLTHFLANAAVFALFLFLTYYFQRVLGYSPIMTGVAFLPMMVAIAVVVADSGRAAAAPDHAGHRRRRLDRL